MRPQHPTGILPVAEEKDLSPQSALMKVVLVSQPGMMHNVLLSTLRAVPSAIVYNANGALTAYELFEEQQADAVVIDANIPLSERLALIRRIKTNFPQVRCIVLTTTTRNHASLHAAGADSILLQDSSPQEVGAAIVADAP
jgi:DNA-binding NarL/FixJ family response regulator